MRGTPQNGEQMKVKELIENLMRQDQENEAFLLVDGNAKLEPGNNLLHIGGVESLLDGRTAIVEK
jgi:hypothetical protein